MYRRVKHILRTHAKQLRPPAPASGLASRSSVWFGLLLPVPSIYSSARTELAKLLIYGLFRKIRVLAQDGIDARKAYDELVAKWTPLAPAVVRSLEEVPWCINTGKSLIPLTLRFLAQKRNLLIPLEGIVKLSW